MRDVRVAAGLDTRAGRPPAVSVIVPAYNAASFIAEALDSVFAQRVDDLEVIVVNDGSPDTEELERVLEAYRDRIVYIVQENRGPSGARNRAIREAHGEYVAFLDSDDVWLPNFLDEQLAVLQRDASLDLVYADAELFGDSPLAGRTFMELTPSHGPVTLEALLSFRCTVATSAVVARRATMVEAGLFDERFTHAEDLDLWLRVVAAGGRIGYSERVLVRHRMHPASLAASDVKLFAGQIAVLRKALETQELSEELVEVLQERIRRSETNLALETGRAELFAGRYASAREHLTAANQTIRDPRLYLVVIGLSIAPRMLRRLLLVRRNRLVATAR